MNLFTLAISNLRRRPGRSLVVSASVGLALASSLSLVTLADSVGRNAGESADERGADMLVMSRNATDVFSSLISQDAGARLVSLEGIATASGELIMLAPIDRDRQNLITGWPADSFFWRDMPLVSGRVPRPGERAMVLGEGTAETLHTKVGDRFTIFDETFTVVGVAGYRSAINRSMIFVLLPDLQEIAFRQGQVTMFDLQLKPDAAPDAVKVAVERAGAFTAAPTDQMLARDRNIQVMRAVSRSVSLIAMVMGSLSVLNTLMMAVQERTREVGVMMAIGWSRWRTMSSIVFEGLLIGVGGCLFGVPMSFLIAIIFEHLPNVEGILTFRPTLTVLIPTLGASIAICAIGSFYPAWRAASMSPADALRRV